MVKVDLQNHWSTKSRVFEARDLAERAYSRLGSGAVVGLVNYGDKRYEVCAERSEIDPRVIRKNNCLVVNTLGGEEVTIIKGEEVPTKEGDLLVMGTREGFHLTPKRSLEDTCKEARENNGVIIVTTPYFRSRVGEILESNPNLTRYIDAVETHNGNMPLPQNRRTTELYLRLLESGKMGAIASSDGHSFREVGTSYTHLELKPDTQETDFAKMVSDALRDGVKESRLLNCYERSNGADSAIHAGIIASMIACSKLPKPVQRIWPFSSILNRGDKLALR